ncbi:hypothetical protein WEN_00585 [Mycoplasma wenyonii str. Massachusetts]|uniref:DUF31 domain-containing protein n=1 Tax=Mycoplasma wenyonii (strain Massachusetts) TaxID=1197325 RepID=I6YL10_MYCWM|nr:hypothetical protein [Mycoplasma wenyonii]AFN64924.1 hypothetical protein WEN_00585 [Mycoplasma wenyonii str. Massachusetts]
MPITWKSGTVLFSAIVGSIVGAKKLIYGSGNSITSPNSEKVTLARSDSSVEHAEPTEENKESFREAQKFLATEPYSSATYADLPESTYSNNNLISEEERQKRIAQAEKIHKVLNDYTFKLVHPCSFGTGWILDYELPKEGEKYPTTWYFGTAAHVVDKWRFVENPYGQILPVSEEATKSLRALKHKRQFNWSGVGLLSMKGCSANIRQGYFDIAIIRQDSDFNYKSDLGLLHNKKIKEPKLFYAPINFLNEDSSLDVEAEQQRDFAIIEIEFTDEEIARKVTNNFATKYPVESKEALNFFAPSLTEKYTEEALNKSEEDFYHLGYPGGAGDKWKYTTTFNPNTGRGLRLSDDERYLVSDKDKKRIRGLANSYRVFDMSWEKGKKRIQVGNHYVMKSDSWGYRLRGGASGSMIVDKDGNVLGLLEGSGQLGDLQSFWTPLRQSKIEGRERGDLRSPKYDFILGAEGQKNSYKEQVEKYNKNTWLRKRGWAHKT